MGPYLVIARDRGTSPAVDSAVQNLLAAGWLVTKINDQVTLFLRVDRPLACRIRRDKKVIVLGDAFPSSGSGSVETLLEATSDADDLQTTRTLASGLWGRFVLLVHSQEGELKSVFRDPSGGLGCTTWRYNSQTVVTSLPGLFVRKLRPRTLSVDWDIIAAQLADPMAVLAGSSLRGVSHVVPGSVRNVKTQYDEVMWSPSKAARFEITDAAAGRETLVNSVENAISNLACDRAVVSEVSGGLDSGIVATTLCKMNANVVGLFHAVPGGEDAEERLYAQAIAEHVDRPITISILPKLEFDFGHVASLQQDIAPNISSFDGPVEQAASDFCHKSRAEALFTGMGGDAVFWTVATPLMLNDRLAREGILALTDNFAANLARWKQTSILSVYWAAFKNRRNSSIVNSAPPWLHTQARAPLHPWLIDLDGISPAKRLQIFAVTLMLALRGMTARDRIIDVIHPLLTQPVLEAGLSIPIDILVFNGRDRGLARQAFSDRLPKLVLERRSKADTTERVARGFAVALPAMRELLLGGKLAEQKIIDVDLLSDTLSEDVLARGGDLHALYRCAAIELWIREWDDLGQRIN